ncbi:MAG TPA: hypothetical protein VNK04_03110 [Gemmataceae bacterium]|nr:hypothetical protein [Gemmataceae bacterium]
MAAIRIRRPTQYADWLRKYRLFVDGVPVAEISRGSEVEIDVTPGWHEVLARIDWCSSGTLWIEVRQDEVCQLEVGSNIRGWRMFVGFVYAFILRSRYLYLRCC